MPDRIAGTLTLVLLLAEAWLLTSRDGVTWTETHVQGSFDMAAAPDSRGLFLGDYQGPVSAADPAHLRALHSLAIAATMEQRVPGWRERVQGAAR